MPLQGMTQCANGSMLIELSSVLKPFLSPLREAFIKKKNKMTFVILGGGGGQKFSKCHLFKSCV